MDDFQIVDTTDQTTYIYALLDPDTCEVRYVGKSDAPVQRHKDHVSTSQTRWRLHCDPHSKWNGKPTPKEEWIVRLAEQSRQPLLAILAEVRNLPKIWGQAERHWIQKLTGQGHRLTNTEVIHKHKSKDELLQDALDLGHELFDTDL